MIDALRIALCGVAVAAVIAAFLCGVVDPWLHGHTEMVCWTAQAQDGDKQICQMVRK